MELHTIELAVALSLLLAEQKADPDAESRPQASVLCDECYRASALCIGVVAQDLQA